MAAIGPSAWWLAGRPRKPPRSNEPASCLPARARSMSATITPVRKWSGLRPAVVYSPSESESEREPPRGTASDTSVRSTTCFGRFSRCGPRASAFRLSHELRVRGGDRVPLENTDVQRVRAGALVTFVSECSAHEARARHETMDDPVWGAARLQPMDVSKIAESDLRASPAIPLVVNPNETLVLLLHGHPPSCEHHAGHHYSACKAVRAIRFGPDDPSFDTERGTPRQQARRGFSPG